MNLLHIDSSILGEGSASRSLTREVLARLKAAQPDLQVTYRDLTGEPLPHYSAASVAGSDPEQAARDTAVLEEFLAADVLVIGAPLYNFSLPSQLKTAVFASSALAAPGLAWTSVAAARVKIKLRPHPLAPPPKPGLHVCE